jgi:serine protease Do
MKAPTAVLVSLVATLVAACSDGSAQRAEETPAAERIPPAATAPAASATTRSDAAGSLPDFVSLVEQNGAAVVNIEVVQQIRPTAGQELQPDDPLLEFFRRFGMPGPGERGQMPPARGAGSGFIVTPDGYIMTNAHVVADADEVTVRMTDRREFSAKVIGVDLRTDTAVIKIDAQRLPTVRIGDPASLRPGEWVFAIGSPFGLESSATAGIVSATSRAVGGESYVPFIQTDVAVNPGNSGGPLFNMRGEVVGVNSMIFSRTGGYMGLSFAIPIDVANDVREQLIKTGRVVRGRIGVAVQDVNAQLAQSFGLDRPRGALVSAVENDSPAAKSGVQPGDVIVGVGNRDIDQFGDLPSAIARMRPGTTADLRVWRDGKERTIKVPIQEMQEDRRTRDAARGAADEATRLGIAVRTLTPEEKQRAETEGSVLVEEVSGAAALAGVQPGDIILGVNGRRIESVEQLRASVKENRNTVALLIERGDAQVFVPVRIK